VRRFSAAFVFPFWVRRYSPLPFLWFFSREIKNKSGGKAPHSKSKTKAAEKRRTPKKAAPTGEVFLARFV